jgi:hypothetical protein
MVITRRAAVAAASAALALAGAAGISATQVASQAADTGVTQADRQKPRPLQPVSPPGLGQSEVDRPDQANTPITGRTNQFK